MICGVVYFTEVKLLGDPVEIAVVKWEIELELCKVLCLKQLSMPVAVVFAGWMMGGGQIAWQMQNDE